MGITIPIEIPTLYFIAKTVDVVEHWRYFETEKTIRDRNNSKIILLDGNHYIHRTQSKRISEEIVNYFKKGDKNEF